MNNLEEEQSSRKQKNSPLKEGCGFSRGVFKSSNSDPKSKKIYKKYKKLPYNPKLKKRARELRKAGNLSEVLFWMQVKKKKILELDFHRQKIIGNYIVDFYCPELNLVIEIDGSSHNDKVKYDNKRENYLKNLGLQIIHYQDIDVKKNLNSVIENLRKCCLELINERK